MAWRAFFKQHSERGGRPKEFVLDFDSHSLNKDEVKKYIHTVYGHPPRPNSIGINKRQKAYASIFTISEIPDKMANEVLTIRVLKKIYINGKR